MDLELAGKVALVTGSSSGIGFAIARRLHDEGARVVLNGRDADRLQAAAAQIDAAIPTVRADVTDPAACERMRGQLERHDGRLDILVCNVGSGRSAPPGQESVEDWKTMLDVNLLATVNTVRAMTDLLARSRGTVLCMSSICGSAALGAPLTYSAAKAALDSYVRGEARVLARRGVRVNALAPGNILFPGSVWERKLEENPDRVASMLRQEVALNRLGSADEIADFAAFLCSPRSAFATGAIYVVDGGQLRS